MVWREGIILVGLLATCLIRPSTAEGACAYRGFRSSPEVGGVFLDITAQFLDDITTLTGAYFDDRTGQIVLTGKQDSALPQMNKDDLAACIRVIYANKLPEVNIDIPSGGVGHGFPHTVRIPMELKDTHFGWVLFEADRILKAYFVGKDSNTQQLVVSQVPGYKSLLERWKEKEQAAGSIEIIGGWTIRFWFVPKAVTVRRTSSGREFAFDQVTIELRTEVLSGNIDPQAWSAAQEFAAHFNANYLAFAEEQRILFELLELAKITGVVRWLRDNNIPIDLTWVDDYQLAFREIPADIPEAQVEAAFEQGGNTYRMWFAGGVQFARPNDYVIDEATASALREAARRARPDELVFGWDFTGSPAQKASSHSLTKSRKEGSFSRTETDLLIPARGQFDLIFQRFYSSFNPQPGPLGYGWDYAPFELAFPVPTDMATGTFKGVTANFQRRVVLIDRLEGKQIPYLVTNDENRPTNYYPQDTTALATLLRRNADGTYTVTQKDQSQIHFDLQGRLLRLIDRNGNTTTFTYDGLDRLATITDPSGRSLSLRYTDRGRISEVTTPDPAISVFYLYDGADNLVTVSGPGNDFNRVKERYFYNQAHQIIQIGDGEERTVARSSYDVYGRTVTQTDSSGQIWSASYSLDGRTALNTDGQQETFRAFDEVYRPIEVKDPEGNSATFAYLDFSDEPATIVDPRGATTQFGFDRFGNRIVTIFPQPFNHQIQTLYDEKHRPVRATDLRYASSVPEGSKVTLFSYDERGNLIRREEGLPSNVTTFEYDGFGQLTREVDPHGGVTTYAYDNFGSLTQVTDPDRITTRYEYDPLSRRVATIDPLGNRTAFTYDPAGQLTATTQIATLLDGTPQTLTTRFAYDSQGNLIERIDPAGRSTMYTHDFRSLLTSVIDANRQETTYSYDIYGNKIWTRDALGRFTTYGYDRNNRLIRVTLPSGATTTYTYDPNGNRLSRTTPEGQRTTYRYDSLNRLTETEHPSGPGGIRSYDERGNVTETIDASGRSVYTYDRFDRLVRQLHPGGQSVEYLYDLNGNLTELKALNGSILEYFYTPANRLRVVDHSEPADQTGMFRVFVLAELGYDPAGRLQSIRRFNVGDLTSSLQYDEAGRLIGLEHRSLQDRQVRSAFQYTYDLAGNRMSERSLRVRTVRGTTADEVSHPFQFETSQYEYDALDRLTSVRFPDGRSVSYTYDAVGNRLNETTPFGQTTAYTYNGDDQLLSTSDGRRFAYDKNGRLLDEFRGGQLFRRYAYDPEDRLLRVEQGFNPLTFSPLGLPAERFRFTYDLFGRRMTTDHNGELTRHLYRLDGPLPLLLYEQTATDPRIHLWAGSTLLAEGPADPAQWQWPLFDALGTTTETVNASGALTGIFHQDPWGLPTDTIDASALQGFALPTAPLASSVTHRFTGEPQLDGLGLVYLRARWYDPTLGRFLTRDPLNTDDPSADQTRRFMQDLEPQTFLRDDRNPQSLHPYTYVQNNPLNYTDPTGEVAWKAAAQALRAGAVAAAKWIGKNVRVEGPRAAGAGVRGRSQIFEIQIKQKPVLTAEGPSLSGGSVAQVRFLGNALIVRLDKDPKWHVNVEVPRFKKNIHIPRCR